MTTTTPPNPQDGDMPDTIIAYESAGRWWVPADYAHMFPPSMQTHYIKTSSLAERLEKIRKDIPEWWPVCSKNETERQQGWNAAIDAIRDSMIKEAGRE